ncbi:MAG TPA: trehalase family glycosidase [bacterium]|nr:trehalase family glycosidase [bacterium]
MASDVKKRLMKNNPVHVAIGGESFDTGISQIYRLLRKNLRGPILQLKHPFAVPALRFPAAYCWDSAFISQIWKVVYPEIGELILRNLLEHQKPDGRIPHLVSPFSTSALSQPPLFSFAIFELFRYTANRPYLEYAYPVLKRYNKWWWDKRYNGELFFWNHPYESGIDNSPRFSDRAETVFVDTTKMGAVDLNSYIAGDLLYLEKIAAVLGRDDEAAEFRAKREPLLQRINELLWCAEDGIYYDYDFIKKKQIRIKTLASFFPLWAGVATEQNAAATIERYLRNSGEFNTGCPFPSVSLSEPSFELDMWRGPNWVNTSYLVVKGLQNYGETGFAADCAYRIASLLIRTGARRGTFYEYYNPHTGDINDLTRKKGNLYKQITLGSTPVREFCGWSGLALTLLLEDVFGMDIAEKTCSPAAITQLEDKKVRLKHRVLGIDFES